MTSPSSLIARGHSASAAPDGHPLRDPARLASIRRHRLLDTTQDGVFDRAAHLAARLADAPLATVSIVTGAAQHLVGASGLTGPVSATRRIPATSSLCQDVVCRDTTLVVTDVTRDPTLAPATADAVASGDLRVAAYLGVPLHDADGQVLGTLCVIDHEPRTWADDDLSALEELASFVRTELLLRDHLSQVERSMQARDDLVRTEAHDLRAAVSAILGAMQTLEGQPKLGEDQRAALLGVGLRQGEHVKAMMEALLDPTRSAGIHLASTEVAEIVEASVTAASVALGGRERIVLDLEPIAIATHAPSLERILINLIRNGLQHTEGELNITGRRHRDAAVITVADRGPGLPEWLLSGDLGDASLRGRADGNGIGLFSAVTLVRNLGGDLTVDSSSAGTTFSITLPDRPRPDPTIQLD